MAGQLQGVQIPQEKIQNIISKGTEFTIGKENIQGLSRVNAQGVVMPLQEGDVYKVNGHSGDGKTLYVSKKNPDTGHFDNVINGIKVSTPADLKKVTVTKPPPGPVDTSTKSGQLLSEFQNIPESSYPLEITVRNQGRNALAQAIPVRSPAEAEGVINSPAFKDALKKEGAAIIRVKGNGYSSEKPITGDLGTVKAEATPEPPEASPKPDADATARDKLKALTKDSPLLAWDDATNELIVKQEDGTESARFDKIDDIVQKIQEYRGKTAADLKPKAEPATPKPPSEYKSPQPAPKKGETYVDASGLEMDFQGMNAVGDYMFVDDNGKKRFYDEEGLDTLRKKGG
jgi:hypothetical protein